MKDKKFRLAGVQTANEAFVIVDSDTREIVVITNELGVDRRLIYIDYNECKQRMKHLKKRTGMNLKMVRMCY